MNRRSFLKLFGLGAAAVALPITLLSYDPVQQTVLKPKQPDPRILHGYRGNQFMETGIVYAPYIPLIITNDLGYIN